ncbi:YhcH/YjgK/YiaL family protein [Chitinophagaceae bacterium LWZ2-11]
MVIDRLSNAHLYTGLGEHIAKALQYLQTTDLSTIAPGKYEIDGDNIFASISEYDTVDASTEQQESHKKYIDVQYVVKGSERFGHSFLTEQIPSKAYDEEKDFMLFADKPDFFSVVTEGMFTIFYPTDLHMPGISIDQPSAVKKVVVKVKTM